MQRVGSAEALERYLDLNAAQMKLTAQNLANADTPGYKAQGFDFDAEFSAALQRADGGAGPRVGDVDGLVARPDGNTVSAERENLQLAKTQLQFRMGVELLKHEFSSMMSAIHADNK